MINIICQKCQKSYQFEQVKKGCSCGHNLFKISGLGTYPTMDNPDRPGRDPYRKKDKHDGQGWKRTTPLQSDPEGDLGAGLGSNVRSKDDPRAKDDVSMHSDEYVEQAKNDIADMEETNIDIHFPGRNTTGPKEGTFFDPTDSLGYDAIRAKEEPIGPHNMQNKPQKSKNRTNFDWRADDIYQKLKNRS